MFVQCWLPFQTVDAYQVIDTGDRVTVLPNLISRLEASWRSFLVKFAGGNRILACCHLAWFDRKNSAGEGVRGANSERPILTEYAKKRLFFVLGANDGLYRVNRVRQARASRKSQPSTSHHRVAGLVRNAGPYIRHEIERVSTPNIIRIDTRLFHTDL